MISLIYVVKNINMNYTMKVPTPIPTQQNTFSTENISYLQFTVTSASFGTFSLSNWFAEKTLITPFLKI